MNTFLRLYSFFVIIYDVLQLIISFPWTILRPLVMLVRPPNENGLGREKILVVGTARGVGKELVLQLASLGAEVVCWDIDTNGNQTTIKEARHLNYNVRGYTCDVSNRDKVLETAKQVKQDVGDVTMLFHCCGLPSPRSLDARPPPTVQNTIDLGVMSHFWLLEAFLPPMIERNHGHIVALTSVAGLNGLKDQVPMCASQFAVRGMIEALSEELRAYKTNRGINLTLVHIFPFILKKEVNDIRHRVPSYFGTIEPKDAAKQIIQGVRRNYMEISIPRHGMYIGNLVRILPRKASLMFRELLDIGIDFC